MAANGHAATRVALRCKVANRPIEPCEMLLTMPRVASQFEFVMGEKSYEEIRLGDSFLLLGSLFVRSTHASNSLWA